VKFTISDKYIIAKNLINRMVKQSEKYFHYEGIKGMTDVNYFFGLAREKIPAVVMEMRLRERG